MKLKFIITAFILMGITQSCNNEINGYYKSISQKETDFSSQVFYRVHEDSIVKIKVSNQKVDSTLYVWDGKFYQDVFNKNSDGLMIELSNNEMINWESFAMGDKPYEILDNEHITFNFKDTFKYKKGKKIRDLYMSQKDTLKRIPKSSIKYVIDAKK